MKGAGGDAFEHQGNHIPSGGASGRHPKGARSIGIGHPRSGDRCLWSEPRPYPSTPIGRRRADIP